jgi:hypothetical protein
MNAGHIEEHLMVQLLRSKVLIFQSLLTILFLGVSLRTGLKNTWHATGQAFVRDLLLLENLSH